MKEVKVLKYQACYPELKRKLYTDKPQIYGIILIHIRLKELQENRMKMYKVGKPNYSGTKVTFAPVETVEEYQKELEKIVSDGKALELEFEKIKNTANEKNET